MRKFRTPPFPLQPGRDNYGVCLHIHVFNLFPIKIAAEANEAAWGVNQDCWLLRFPWLFGFRFQVSAPPLAKETASLIEKETVGFSFYLPQGRRDAEKCRVLTKKDKGLTKRISLRPSVSAGKINVVSYEVSAKPFASEAASLTGKEMENRQIARRP